MILILAGATFLIVTQLIVTSDYHQTQYLEEVCDKIIKENQNENM